MAIENITLLNKTPFEANYANPAAGNSITFQLWTDIELSHISFQCVTTATVATRSFGFSFTNKGGVKIYDETFIDTQVASLTRQYIAAMFGFAVPINGIQIYKDLPRFYLSAGTTIAVNQNNLQAGDQLSNVTIGFKTLGSYC